MIKDGGNRMPPPIATHIGLTQNYGIRSMSELDKVGRMSDDLG